MARNVVNAFNPVWGPDRDTIHLWVQFEEIDDALPFTAQRTDPENHGRQLYQDAVAGRYGPIAPCPLSELDQLNKGREWSVNEVDRKAKILKDQTSIHDILHQEKYREAMAIKDDLSPSQSDYPLLSIDGSDLEKNAQDVITIHKQALVTIAKIELTRKEAIRQLNAAVSLDQLHKFFNSIAWPD